MGVSGAGGDHAGKAPPEHAFTTYDVQACLYDHARVRLLQAAIRQVVRPGDIVVDAGSGTGLLGLFAAQAGAGLVYCVEINPEFIPIIEENARRNGLAERIVAVHADATTHRLPTTVDVIISEVISAGFFYESQVQIVNHLRRYLRPGGVVVPAVLRNHVELIHAQESLYGLTFTFDSRFTALAGDRSMSERACYQRAEFAVDIDPTVRARACVRASATGVANAVRISYDIEFASGIRADRPTAFLLNPEVIFLPAVVPLVAGASYEVGLRYEAGALPRSCAIDVLPR